MSVAGKHRDVFLYIEIFVFRIVRMDEAAEEISSSPEFDWEWAAQTVGASAKQVLFVQARINGASATQAARMAGYKATSDEAMRSVGYQTGRSPKVQALTALAMAQGAGVAESVLTVSEAKKILSQMARRGNASIKVPAIKALRDIEADETAKREGAETYDPAVTLRLLIAHAGEGGLLSAVGTCLKVHSTLTGFPFAKQSLPFLRVNYPEFWARMLKQIVPEHHRNYCEQLANGPVVGRVEDIGADAATMAIVDRTEAKEQQSAVPE